mmetsp:Transcript_17488/g.22793  ORF Transcript_17488/g.22793 Transcript_17488/m.22793 type:complete len:119 (+) Transcript_17488:133-489(+)|eukprot:CAMPEP_0197285306 /NCGR_PEP_ID=MMETSP0890-20130614/517_1 /TAXON_ID=44058 ORGANISM="Aureoumbra lagunensis, Strain CCMP1510" /NCGR_SAMPLE_ID=MMETSP0890 /ASSEMBLY_ACC=CAM_ASM_000533 /LENGTH=118 /DNA_ID=CAMNT_0042752657 /DNA_START=72 /DNA_END=428 /DNA_ORIENTATION=+
MPVVVTGTQSVVGSVTYTSWDGYVTKTKFSLDQAKPPLLWRHMGVGQKEIDTEGEACVSLETALGQLEAYKTKFASYVKGDNVDSIISKLKTAAPADPAAIRQAEKVAEQEAAAAEDY